MPVLEDLTTPVGTLPSLRDAAVMPEVLAERLVAVRRHLHRHPELGWNEHATSGFVRALLEANGLVVHSIARTGLYVDIVGAHPGPHIGYRADMDALPIQDGKDVPYRSETPGVAHLCGHDAHTTVGLGVALLLQQQRDTLHGTVRVFFQPNEEGTPGGATFMVADGILDGLEAVYCIHVDPSLPTGRYGLITGAATAAVDQFQIEVKAGRTGHSARPHQATDTIWIATQIAQALYQVVGRMTDSRNASILTLCRFHAGDAYNVIPAEVDMGGTFRSTSPFDRAFVVEHIRRTARHFADLYDTHAEVTIVSGAPPVLNDGRLINHLEHEVARLFGEAAVHLIPRPSMGGEDFAHYTEHVPGALLRVGTSEGPATSYPLHHACFDLDEGFLAPTALLMARTLQGHLRNRVLGGIGGLVVLTPR